MEAQATFREVELICNGARDTFSREPHRWLIELACEVIFGKQQDVIVIAGTGLSGKGLFSRAFISLELAL